ncbi:hypothetical protein A7K93_08690 [Candidatus Methylacidiphilum fumarolicum]|uniref:Uncharacterized protein n=2 Tax=Candidatus Methylacidiphilum fumarolicum TaxID=591154 RepID=I0JZR6_METFB|nr:hypothetical protein [Candidatus Methylacidiphilum fumarolicum]MBW6415848.1 hypothetical protein [Candidatus Methylacidiphilum fumarolicum]TFE67667.1 hypothetical protein A7K73_08620 [Candidatus Methylacidiphilum fumarolicum]TFE72416.1 hypothetical protein A7K93_08690 [Candidatus Methylacidiphilum fumarolicum]TFE72434.1 hypothetical protein A7K72_08645 [Candidatus Methylacidiphilum fumarolicum]TFE77791.1 hypothetical protein A7D33_02935 [Candidatus Methylacidiphilum fumarolicum]
MKRWSIVIFFLFSFFSFQLSELLALRAAKTPLATPRLLRFLDQFPEGEQMFIRSYLAFDCTHDYIGTTSADGEEFYFISEDGNERKGVLLFSNKNSKIRFVHYCSFCYVYRDLPKIGLSSQEVSCIASFWARRELAEKGEGQLRAEALASKNKIYPLQKEAYEKLGILP